LKARLGTFWGDPPATREENRAEQSYEERQYLMEKAVEGMEHYPILGVGPQNFEVYSGVWREVHMTYLQIGVEGGIPALILYLAFFIFGFRNLRKVLKKKDLEKETMLLAGAIQSSMFGFAVGALFSPEAYQFFPYFAVAYSWVLLAIVREKAGEQVIPVRSLLSPVVKRIQPGQLPRSPQSVAPRVRNEKAAAASSKIFLTES
jgi:O-antigen ligase